jgi:hypothetical protein
VSVAIVALYTVLALRPPRRPMGLARATFVMTHWVNEYPFIAFAALAVSTVIVLAQGDVTSAGGWVLLGVAVVTALGLLHVARRASLAGAVVEKALADQFGAEWQAADEDRAGPRPLSPLRVLRDVVAPFPVRPRAVQRMRNVAYGDAGKRNLMDLYRCRDAPPAPGPVLIHFHGGHFQTGRKSREALPLLYRLANEGWLCISANYRLRAAGRFPNSLIDAKTVIAGADARRRTRGRAVPDRRRGRVGRRPPGFDGSADPQPPGLPASRCGRGHDGRRRGVPVRVLRPANIRRGCLVPRPLHHA